MKKLILVIFLINIINSAQSLTGLSGLVTIPNTEMMNDGEVRVGAAFLPREHVSLYSENYDGLATYASFGFLPFIEVGLRFTRLLNYNKGDQALGDRMPSIRLRLLNESEYIPGVVAGLHDFLRTSESQTIYNAASYIVLSKTLINQNSVNLSLVTGYDFNLIKAGSSQFNGFFGGSEIKLFDNYEFLIEYDSRVWNGGIRLNIFGFVNTTLAFIKMKYPSGNLNFSIII